MVDTGRMLVWIVASALFYGAAFIVEAPILQTIAIKLGNVTVAGNIGYWLSRTAIGRLNGESSANEKIARAIIIGAAMVGISLGL